MKKILMLIIAWLCLIPICVNASQAKYYYDDKGLRTKKELQDITIIYHYDEAGQVICETDEKGNIKSSYIYANGARIARICPDGSMQFYHNNELGTPVAITDKDGNVIERTVHEPFGNIVAKKNSAGIEAATECGFTGKERDMESGLYYFGARYYDPIVGRFISKDTGSPRFNDPQSLNRYIYCLNNPLKYVDPDGNDAILYVDRNAVNIWMVGAQGHMGMFYQDVKGDWFKEDLHPADPMSYFNGKGILSVNQVPQFDPAMEMLIRGTDALYINTSVIQDQIISLNIGLMKYLFDNDIAKYHLLDNNCKDITLNALNNGGVDLPFKQTMFGNDPRPNYAYNYILENINGNRYMMNSFSYFFYQKYDYPWYNIGEVPSWDI